MCAIFLKKCYFSKDKIYPRSIKYHSRNARWHFISRWLIIYLNLYRRISRKLANTLFCKKPSRWISRCLENALSLNVISSSLCIGEDAWKIYLSRTLVAPRGNICRRRVAGYIDRSYFSKSSVAPSLFSSEVSWLFFSPRWRNYCLLCFSCVSVYPEVP